MRAVIADHTLLGEKTMAHVDLANPRRGEWWVMWKGLPGLLRVNGKYRHVCLPGWEYTRAEIKAEMIPDLERLAEHGIRPTEATR